MVTTHAPRSALEQVVLKDFHTNDEWKVLVRGVDFTGHLKQLDKMETAIRDSIRRLQSEIELREMALLDIEQERGRYEAWITLDNERSTNG